MAAKDYWAPPPKGWKGTRLQWLAAKQRDEEEASMIREHRQKSLRDK